MIRQLALKRETQEPSLEYGEVTFGNGEFFGVRTPYGEILTEKALSCLIEPCAGDKVLLSHDGAGLSFILAVLQRQKAAEGQTEMLFTGPVSIRVRDGGLRIAADETLSLASLEKIGIAASELTVHAERGVAEISDFSFLARVLHSQIKRVKLVSGTVEQICRRLTQRLENSFRFIKEHDEVQSGTTRMLVEETLSMHAKNSLIVAEEHVKVDAGQIHLG